ncbi:hypothetical protein Q7317_06235, partial [Glaesserella parasuis]|nr:hypothetical protein [Glaesserella parasuis]
KILFFFFRKNFFLNFVKLFANVVFGGLLAADLQHKGGYQLFPPPPPPSAFGSSPLKPGERRH